MKRRGFLGLLAGAAVAPFVPTLVSAPSELTTLMLTSEERFEPWEPVMHEIGTTVTVRIPQRYLVRDDCSYQPQDLR